jgi:hypothetical protein
MNQNEFVRAAVYETESAAILAKAVLEDNQITVTMSGLEPSALGLSLDGEDSIEVFVRQSDFEKAQKLLSELEEVEEEITPAWNCDCGEEVDEGFFVCWSCGEEYQADKKA